MRQTVNFNILFNGQQPKHHLGNYAIKTKIMKIKTFLALVGLFCLAIISTAFVHKPNAPKPSMAKDLGGEPFLLFLSQFKKVELPYTIGLEDMEGYADYGVQIKTKSSGAKPIKPTPYLPASSSGKFSRMGPPELTPVARFYPSPQMVAVVYASKQRFGADLHASYNLALYDLKGNILPKAKDKMAYRQAFNLAFSSVDKTMTCRIDTHGNITQQVFQNQWRKNLAENGLDGNMIQGFKAENTLAFQIDAKGNIAEQKEKIPATASRAEP